MTIWMSGSETRGIIWSISGRQDGDEQEQTEGQRFPNASPFGCRQWANKIF